MARPLTVEQAADLAEVTSRGIRWLATTDDPPVKGHDGYPCIDFGQWLQRRHLRGIGVSAAGAKFDLDSEKARLTHHQANLAELSENDTRANLIPADMVAQEWQQIADQARAVIGTVPGRLAKRLGPEIEVVARLIVAEVLEELDPR